MKPYSDGPTARCPVVTTTALHHVTRAILLLQLDAAFLKLSDHTAFFVQAFSHFPVQFVHFKM